MRCFRSALEERLVRLVRDDGGAFVNRRSYPTEMVPVMMHGDHVANWLARDDFLCFRDDRQSTRFAVWRIDEHDVILHFNRQAVMCSAGEPEHTIRKFLRIDGDRRQVWSVADI